MRIKSSKQFLESQQQANLQNIDASIIVVVFNQHKTLPLILKSLAAQNFQGKYEVIISDDGSNKYLFQKCRDEFNKYRISLKYIWQQDRYFRVAAARNNGIKISKGKYLIFLDGDLVPSLDFVKQHLQMHKKPKLLITGNRKWRGKIDNKSFTKLNGIPIKRILYGLEHQQNIDKRCLEAENKERTRRITWLHSSNPWRACFSGNLSVERNPEIFFDENFIGWGPEDWEFSYRLCIKHGYTPIYDDKITTYHLESAISKPFITKNHDDIVRYLRNTFYFYDKCPGLTLEEIFFWLPRFRLNRKLDKWEVVPRPESYILEDIIKEAKRWLVKK